MRGGRTVLSRWPVFASLTEYEGGIWQTKVRLHPLSISARGKETTRPKDQFRINKTKKQTDS